MASASSTKIASAFLLAIIYYLFTSFFIDDTLLTSTNGTDHKIEPLAPVTLDVDAIDHDAILNQQHIFDETHSQWRPFHHYAAIPNFYIKKKGVSADHPALTICSICDLSLLHEARAIVSNYQSGPISLAVFIDGNYKQTDTEALYQLIDATFIDIAHAFDITVGVVAVNFSSPAYVDFLIDREFSPDTPLTLTLPINVLRNLAESQVRTQWLFTIDIDFCFLSVTFSHASALTALLRRLDAMVAQYGVHTVFVVPAFEVISPTANQSRFTQLNKGELLDAIYDAEIAPFDADLNSHKCTAFDVWYHTPLPYRLDCAACHYAYEPWFIVRRDVSVQKAYAWDAVFVGRGLNKVERVYRLRSECWNFVVMDEVFMIHKLDETKHYGDGDGDEDEVAMEPMETMEPMEDVHDDDTTYNFELFQQKMDNLSQKAYACHNSRHEAEDTLTLDMMANMTRMQLEMEKQKQNLGDKPDKYCNHGLLSRGRQPGHCRVCCEKSCGKCGGDECGGKPGKCCIGPILRAKRSCDKYPAPCEMTLPWYCPGESAKSVVKGTNGPVQTGSYRAGGARVVKGTNGKWKVVK